MNRFSSSQGAAYNSKPMLVLQGKYCEADPLYLRTIEIGEKTLGPDHPTVAIRLNNRAILLGRQVRVVRIIKVYCSSYLYLSMHYFSSWH